MYIYAHKYILHTIATKYIHTIRHNGGGTLKNAVVINTLVSKGMQKVIGM